MSSLSLDLRTRIVARYHRGGITYVELAKEFDVGEASVSRLLRRERENGSLERDPPGGGFPPRIADEKLPLLIQLVAEKPDRTALELCEIWRSRYGGPLSLSSMKRALERAGLTFKKKRSDLPSRTAKKSSASANFSSKKSVR